MAEPAEAHIDESVSTELGERVRAIVAAAESMASAMKQDAEQYATARRREADEESERRLREARERADRMVQERVLRMSELSDSSQVMTTDSDFRIYRRKGRHVIPLLIPR